ncbi:DUF4832 domain-containing protein [Winogradskya humida]|uniref:DUF4832 domain-containing protein n=1 Tax=Winogradskya humida TaxID=113566 RepID=A0ABQ3ZYT5_9ACTN|nr:DUF4832 domain-containing protein [Actinoplanes humidus]GIE23747.1 hypothetical protein Ahu01nite_068490 [Actinoplanes humidus]
MPLKRMPAAALTGLLCATIVGAAPPFATKARAADNSVAYSADGADIANPERGFYHYPGNCDSHDFDRDRLLSFRRKEHISLVMCMFYLTPYKHSPISDAALKQFQQQADVVRSAGLKMVVRFAYTADMGGDDATSDRILAHIDQLAPVLRANADIIHVLQAGFIGAWGEWYYTQNFGNLGQISPADWANRKAILDKLLTVLPADRMLQVRTMAYKQTLYDPDPVSDAEAYSGTIPARLGHHNDCFLAAADDMGTFRNPNAEYPYLEADTRYVAMGGETCAKNSPRTDCPTAVQELTQFHYNFLNEDYHPDVLASWSSGGCIDTIRRSLGYRFTLVSGSYPDTAAPGGTLPITFTVRNDGWSAPANPRDAALVLRNTETGINYLRFLSTDPRHWAPGTTTTATETVSLNGLAPGTYDLLLDLPDPGARLAGRPEYSIHLANENLWEPSTGYNKLRHKVTIS